jgi:ABC-type sugar transport system ATPase subunit
MLLQVQGVTKSFGDNAVLRGVDLSVEAGEVVALVGENGAGKSTLTRVISGVHRPDAGAVTFSGERQEFAGPQAAMACGIQVIYQEFRHNLFPHLSVTENLFVRGEGRDHGRVLVSRARMRKDAAELLASIGLDVDPQRTVGSLGVAEQQMVEIAKAIGHDLRLLVLDEPTAALDDRESEQLFRQVRRLRESGVGVLYISHRLDEIFELADRIVVLRDGKVALEAATADTTPDAVVSAMVGRTVDDFYPKEHHVRDGDPALSVRGLTSPGRFADVSFDVRPGEVLGIAGVLGSGRGDVLRALFGMLPRTAGEIRVDGTPRRLRRPAAAIRAGIGYVVPDRGAAGLCVQRPVSENISLASLGSYSGPAGVVRRGREREAVNGAIKQLRVRAASSRLPVGTLSGGNQQKTLFAKWLLTRPRVLLMEEPTRGVDVGAKTEIYRIINELTADGVAIVLVSSDLPELVAMSDRVLVMRGGRVAVELTGDDIDQQHVLTHSLEVAS